MAVRVVVAFAVVVVVFTGSDAFTILLSILSASATSKPMNSEESPLNVPPMKTCGTVSLPVLVILLVDRLFLISASLKVWVRK